MPPLLALLLGFAFVCWLFAKDFKRRSGCSGALWIPLIWIAIVGSRTVADWVAVVMGTASSAEEMSGGNAIDTAVFLSLILAGGSVLVRRRLSWGKAVANNKWLLLYFCYTGASILWADTPFSSFKLWVKDIGNIVMILVILSERDPVEALRSTLLRSGYILLTLSVVLIKYFPEIGRAYDMWTYQPVTIGASADKNFLGATVLVCSLGLFWAFYEGTRFSRRNKLEYGAHVLLVLMACWILIKAHSATSLSCTILGAAILAALKSPAIRRMVKGLNVAIFVLVPVIALVLEVGLNLGDNLLATLERDITLTGRTRIWEDALKAEIDPLVGAGYCSFWTGDRAKAIAKGLGFFYALKEAHSGYIDAYLNGGCIGLIILAVLLLANAAKTLRRLDQGDTQEPLRFTFLVLAIIYNITESAFNGLHPIWFMLLVALLGRPFNIKRRTSRERSEVGGDQAVNRDNPRPLTNLMPLAAMH